MTAAYHPTAAELDAIRRDPTCDARADDEVRFIHLSDLMGEPQ